MRHWKRRTGFTESGTTAQMVERWLWLAWNQQQECTLGWGPDADDQRGYMSANVIAAFVLRVGLPPTMLTARARPPSREEIERMFAKPAHSEGLHMKGSPHFNPYGKSVEMK